MHNDTDTVARAPEHAPINWVTMILFTALPLAAVTVVPWYGFTHGFSASAFVLMLVFLWACGISITAGYHRSVGAPRLQRALVRRTFLMLFGAMALQNSILIWGSQHRTHHRFVDDWDKDPYSAKRGFWFSHMGWILRDYPSGIERLLERARPRARPDRHVPAPLLRAAHDLHERRGAAARGLGRRRRLGRVPARGHRAARAQPPLHLVHQLAGPHVGHAAVHRRELRPRQSGCWRS